MQATLFGGLAEVDSLDAYLAKYGPLLGQQAERNLRPLVNPATDGDHPGIAELKRAPYPAQAKVITGGVAAMRRQKALLLVAEAGSGKTLQSAAMVHCHAAGRPYNALVMCPGQLTRKWKRELEETLPGVNVRIIDKCSDLIPIWELWTHGGFRKGQYWFIIGRDSAKLGSAKRAAYVLKYVSKGMGRKPHCPACGAAVMTRTKEGDMLAFAEPEDLDKKLQECPVCEEPLWQSIPQPRRFEPAKFIHKKLKGFADYFIADECFPGNALVLMDNHEYKEIRSISTGDRVLSQVDGQIVSCPVTRVICRRRRTPLLKVVFEGGSVVCTSNHLFRVGRHYVPASALVPGTILYSVARLPGVREGIHPKEALEDSTPDVLRAALLDAPQMEAAELSLEPRTKSGKQIRLAKECRVPSHASAECGPGGSCEDGSDHEGATSHESWREREGIDEVRATTLGSPYLRACHRVYGRGPGVAEPLQDRPRELVFETGSRSGRDVAPLKEGEGCRREEDGILGVDWLDGHPGKERGGPLDPCHRRVVCVEAVGDDQSPDDADFVYDLEVGHSHNYFAGGVLVSNCHELKGADTAQANAMGSLAAASKHVIAMTGTLIGGYADHLRAMLWRLAPTTLLADGFQWEDHLPFSERYGRIEIRTTEKEGQAEGNKQSRGSKRTTTKYVRPGIVPSLYGNHLIGNSIFLGLDEMGENLPLLRETTHPVPVFPKILSSYKEVEENLRKHIKEMVRKGDRRLLATLLTTLMAYPDHPFGWGAVGYKDKGVFIPCAHPENHPEDMVYPKERALLDFCHTERALGRQVWVYVQFNGERNVEARLAALMRQEGLSVGVLKASVPLKDREAWIAQHGASVDVMLSHPVLVQTGLDLFDKSGWGHNFCSIAFYETGYVLPTLRQASRRAWRLRQPKECKVAYFYYAETMQERAMNLMGQKLIAAEALEGKFSSEGLIALAGDDGMETALAKSLVSGFDESVGREWTGSRSGRAGRTITLTEVV